MAGKVNGIRIFAGVRAPPAMSLPPDDISPFATRRQRLMDRMRADGGGIAIMATAPEAIRNRDAEYPYRHDSDFFYLTGFTEPDAWLALCLR